MLFLWLGGIAGGIAAVSMAPPIPPPGQCGHVVVGCEANANCTFGAANCSVIGAFQVPTDNGEDRTLINYMYTHTIHTHTHVLA